LAFHCHAQFFILPLLFMALAAAALVFLQELVVVMVMAAVVSSSWGCFERNGCRRVSTTSVRLLNPTMVSLVNLQLISPRCAEVASRSVALVNGSICRYGIAHCEARCTHAIFAVTSLGLLEDAFLGPGCRTFKPSASHGMLQRNVTDDMCYRL
jgi:hypothetical protein